MLAGGLAIMAAAVTELKIERIDPVGGALRLGVLYDLLGRTIDEDARAATVERFIARYGIDRAQALRVGDLAAALYRRAVASPDATLAKLVEWAGRLHEVGMSISHDGFHKHGAYILQNADMPGFSAGEQGRLALLVFGCRGRLAKVAGSLGEQGRPRGGARAAPRGARPPRAHRDRRCRASRSRSRATSGSASRAAGSPRIR